MIPHALKFGAATSDRVRSIITLSSNPSQITYVTWLMPTTLTDTRQLIGRHLSGAGGARIQLSSTGGDVNAIWQTDATASSYVTTDTPLASLSIPKFMVFTMDINAGAGAKYKVYTGDIKNFPSANTMSVISEGTGTPRTLAGTYFFSGNRDLNNQAFQGTIWSAASFETIFTLEEIRKLYSYPRAFLSKAKVFWINGNNGSGPNIDLSGNGYHGVVTGAIPTSDYLPCSWRDLIAA